jgi:hypothetical protein
MIEVPLGILAIGLAGWGAYLALKPPPERPHLVVDAADRDLGVRPVGEQPLEFRLTNRSDHSIRVSGPSFG